jgi:enoyl-CoA hydratase/carnithine racemase
MARPPHNLIEASMVAALRAAFARAVDDGCRCIVLASGLRHFSAGADLAAAQTGALQQVDFIDFLRYIEQLPIPTVAVVHGLALGGGFELALACDLIVAADTAEVGLVETSLGLFPLMGGIARVATRAGQARAKEMVLLGRRYSTATLQQWGVINQVVKADALAETAMALGQQLAAGPTSAYRVIRQIAGHTMSHGVYEADELSLALSADIWHTADARASLASVRDTGTASAVFVGA